MVWFCPFCPVQGRQAAAQRATLLRICRTRRTSRVRRTQRTWTRLCRTWSPRKQPPRLPPAATTPATRRGRTRTGTGTDTQDDRLPSSLIETVIIRMVECVSCSVSMNQESQIFPTFTCFSKTAQYQKHMICSSYDKSQIKDIQGTIK